MNEITLKHREGQSIDCTGVPVDFLRNLKLAGALGKGWMFEETVKRDPFEDEAPVVVAPAKKERKPRATKADAPAPEKAPPSHGEVLDAIRGGVTSERQLAITLGVTPRVIGNVLDEMRTGGKVEHNGKRGKGSGWFEVKGVQS